MGLVGETAENWLTHWINKRNQAIKNLSKYAVKTKKESFAEAFTAHYHQTDKRGIFLQSFKIMLQETDKKKWLSSYGWLYEVEGEERTMALQRIRKLKERLGLL